MRFPGLLALMAMATLATACQPGNSDGEDIPLVAVVKATVDTAQSGCDTKADGACWLPLYPEPNHEGTPLNQRETPDSPCKKVKEAGCWPQPGTEVTLTCIKTAEGRIWLGVSVPPEKVLTPQHSAAPPKLPTTGYNLAQWLRPQAEVNDLPTC